MGEIRMHVLVSGRVQGVWFRDSTRREAGRLGVRGWVANLPDGRVEAVFEGPEEVVIKIVDYVRTGPPNARVQSVEMERQSATGEFSSFEIR